jgi:hypothetical protein
MSDSLLRAVKLFVVVGGVLIVAGTATLIALLVKRGATLADAPAPDAAMPATVTLPSGGEIVRADLAGRDLVLLGRSGRGQFVLVVELATGATRHLVWLAPEDQ